MSKQYKVDLHTHSILSPDGGISRDQYASLLEKEKLDCIAITDHNETKFALEMAAELGPKIIVGEEISTIEGEIIGLFLQKTVPNNLPALHTAKLIHDQGGTVYIPHPFEILRQGLKIDTLKRIIPAIDIVEVFNARSKWRGKSTQALAFAQKNEKAIAAASDSHCLMAMGSSYVLINEMPTMKSLVSLISKGNLIKQYSSPISYLCPAINRIKHKFFNYV